LFGPLEGANDIKLLAKLSEANRLIPEQSLQMSYHPLAKRMREGPSNVIDDDPLTDLQVQALAV
jgi:hypothetical protein